MFSCLALWVAATGCGFGGGAPPPADQLAIENLAKWHQYYRAEHRGKPPADEQEFIGFVEAKLKSRGDTFNREELLKSKRDGHEYVIHYGEPISRDPERNVVVYEKEGYGGMRLVAFETGYSHEIDEAELETLLAGGK